MKTLAIATIVGTLILYIFLAIVHTVLASVIHGSDFKYTPAQDNILNTLSSSNLEDGAYQMKDRMGKPWAFVVYHNQLTYGMSMYIMSFIYNLIAVLILCIALAAAIDRLNSFGQRLWFVMLFPLFVLFSQVMMSYNWDGFPMHFLKGQIIDIVVGYLLVGIWLAWYYGRVAAKRVVS